MKRPHKISISGESRLLSFFKEVGANLKTYGNDLKDEYIVGPYENNDVIQKITGPIMVAASAILEGTDQIVAGIVDTRLEPPDGVLGRMRRDSWEFVTDVATLHPIRAIAAGFRVATSDLILDVGDAVGNFRQ